jgi:hypothetical protein
MDAFQQWQQSKGYAVTVTDAHGDEVVPSSEPDQHCEVCGRGPFFLVPYREWPTLCPDCAEERRSRD